VFHRPFHLTSLETPTSIYKAIVCKEPTVAPEAGQFCDTVAIAKRAIKKGEAISGIGSDDVYGTIVTHASQQEDKLLPIALITPGTIAATDIRKGEAMTGFHVEHTEPMLIHKLREEQDQSIFTR
jgi:predicted homoserine dehydrogenase-like protein